MSRCESCPDLARNGGTPSRFCRAWDVSLKRDESGNAIPCKRCNECAETAYEEVERLAVHFELF